MDSELFLLKMYETKECRSIMYKRLAIREYIGFYYAGKKEFEEIDAFMIPFRDVVKSQLKSNKIDIDNLLKYMIENDESNYALFSATTKFRPAKGMSSESYYSAIAENKIITPYVEAVNIDTFALIVISFIFDNLCPKVIDIAQIVKEEIFAYQTNQYGLTRVNGAVFKKDGLIFDGKGYYYNYFTNKAILNPLDSMAGFAKIIQKEAGTCDILYRLDERLSMPEAEYYDYTGVAFAKFYGPQFRLERGNIKALKTVIVHINDITLDKLLMVIKKHVDHKGEEFWHIEVETLPYKNTDEKNVVTTFLHGMYYPEREIFTHIDYTKNQYNGGEYLQKYTDSQDGMPVDQYTSCKDLHYKIWCIENGEFTKKTWYELMIVSLPKEYQDLLNEILK